LSRDSGLRIVFFGTDGALSSPSLAAIAQAHRLIGVVRPAPSPSPRTPRQLLGAAATALGLRPPRSLADVARASGAPLWDATSGDDPRITELVRQAAPDLICLVGYPWLLRGEIIRASAAPLINLHAALLPRHRGPLPLFWIYHADDRATGVSVHRVTERADAGDILGQEAYPLPRAFPVEELNRLNAERGAALLLRVLQGVGEWKTNATPQDESRATLAPRVRTGTSMIDFEQWSAERVWHFCSGLFPRFLEPLTTADGTVVRYGGVAGYETRDAMAAPGSVTPSPTGWDLHCRDGIVRLIR
jgi:methionyl-tRNA formyltransferase